MSVQFAAIVGALSLVLGACAAANDARGPHLAGSAWQATRLGDGSATADPSRLTLAFSPDGALAVRADCNRGSGTWRSLAPGTLAFGAIATTRMACLDSTDGDRFVADLTKVQRYRLENGQLLLEPTAGPGPLVLRPAPR